MWLWVTTRTKVYPKLRVATKVYLKLCLATCTKDYPNLIFKTLPKLKSSKTFANQINAPKLRQYFDIKGNSTAVIHVHVCIIFVFIVAASRYLPLQSSGKNSI